MKLEQQVCSLEPAKKLKELGVKQESLFYWYQEKGDYEPKIKQPNSVYDWGHQLDYADATLDKEVSELCSAFTVAELGEMLPASITIGGEVMMLCVYSIKTESFPNNWLVVYETDYPYRDENKHSKAFMNTEADARAKMLIWLIENKYL